MSKRKQPTITDVLRQAIEDSGLSLYRIAQDTGVTSQSLLRFQRGETSLRLDKADAVAKYLGLRLMPEPNKRKLNKPTANKK